MAGPDLTRRGFLGNVAGAYTAVAMGAGAVAFAHDPMLSLVNEYRRQRDAFNAGADDLTFVELQDLAERTCNPISRRICENAPLITSQRGSIEAIRMALEEQDDMDAFSHALLTSALAYLESQAA